MNYLIAPDSFKGTLTSRQAAEAMADGIRSIDPRAGIQLIPMADGGEGTLEVLESHLQSMSVQRKRFDFPSSEEHPCAEYLVYAQPDPQGSHQVAVIESAQMIGLSLPQMTRTGLMQRGSSALGLAMRQVVDADIRHIIIALGGSATGDGGLGMLMQLGMGATDANGLPVTPDLDGMLRVRSVEHSMLLPALRDMHIDVLCDVDAPLTGPSGSSQMFSIQKGLAEVECLAVDAAMGDYAGLCERAFAARAHTLPGSGAAGGLGFALALLGGELLSGADYIIQVAGIERALQRADWLVTGEGQSDAQTLRGKIPFKLALAARKAGKKTALVSGRIEADHLARYFDRMIGVDSGHSAARDSIYHAFCSLRAAAAGLVQQRA